MSLFGSGRREGLLAVLTLLLLSIALHAPGLFLGMPRGPAAQLRTAESSREAFTNQDTLLPAMRAAGTVARAGELPLWNTKSRLGEPFLTSGAPILYPPFWLLMLGGGPSILDLLLCLHTFLACMCMYRFCRNMPLGRYVSFLAGALYGLGWFFTAQLDRLPDAAAAALVPLALEFTWRILTSRRRAVYGGWLSVIIALLFSTGGTGIAWLGVGLCFGLVLHRMWALDRDNQKLAWRTIGIALCLTVLMTAPMWIHALVHAPLLLSASPPMPHLQVAGLLGTVSPTAFGGLSAATTEGLQMVNAGADPLELVLFPGTIVLFLGLLGLLRPKRTSLGLFWIAIGGIGLLLSIDGPVAEAVYRFAPAALARPGIALLLVQLAFVILGATALERFFEAPAARSWAVPVTSTATIVLCSTVLLLGFAFPTTGGELVAMLVSGTPSEITAALEHLRSSLLLTTSFGIAIAALFLCWRRMGMLRFKVALEILVVADLLTVATLHTPRSDRTQEESYLTARIPEQSGRAIVVGRNTSMSATPLLEADTPTITTTTPAILSRTAELLSAIDPSIVHVDHKARVLPMQGPQLVTADLLDIAGVGIVLTGLPFSFEGFYSTEATPEAETHATGAAFVHYRIKKVRRANVRFEALHAQSRDAARAALIQQIDNLSETVVLEGSDPAFSCRAPGREPTIAFERDGANYVRLRVDIGTGSGYLVLADAYAPGWTATLDGKRVAVHPANVAQRAVAVPPGEHVIEFRYSPFLKRLGAPLATFGLFLLFGWLWFSRRRK